MVFHLTIRCIDTIVNAKWQYDRNIHCTLFRFYSEDIPTNLRKDYSELSEMLYDVPYSQCLKTMPINVSQLLDSDKKHFKGDLIITDPCYLINQNRLKNIPVEKPSKSDYLLNLEEYDDIVIVDTADLIKHLPEAIYVPIDDKTCKYSYKYNFDNSVYENAKNSYKSDDTIDTWSWTNCGTNTEKIKELGIKQYICKDTLFGDCNYIVLDNYKECIGKICVDSGMVCVTELNEWRNYIPEMKRWLEEHKSFVTIINNFDGEVWFEVEDTSFTYKNENGKEENIKDYTVRIVGDGIRYGKPFRFKSIIIY